MRKACIDLLRTWCDGLLGLQLPVHLEGLAGGVLSPLEQIVSGRAPDAICPLMCLADLTGNPKYLAAAQAIWRWQSAVDCGDHWINEAVGHDWAGITAFRLIAIGEAVHHHGHLLQPAERDHWLSRLRRAADWVRQTPLLEQASINYTFGGAAAMAVAFRLFGDDSYNVRAHAYARTAMGFILPNGLIHGEGRRSRNESVSKRGVRFIDLGYNIEESVPSLALYAAITGDAEAREAAVRALQAHLPFILPDGGLDNAAGSRAFKWTYYGSRTSDGMLPACALLADADPRFLAAGWRNLQLQARCTHNAPNGGGLLHGGPHAHRVHATSVHHTYPHARALAGALQAGLPEEVPDAVPLPADQEHEPIVIPEMGITRVARGPWRATFAAHDWDYKLTSPNIHPAGGSCVMLAHERLGPVLVGTLAGRSPHEPVNTPPATVPHDCLTPRLELDLKGAVATSSADKRAEVSAVEGGNLTKVRAAGRLTYLGDGKRVRLPFAFEWTFDGPEVRLDVRLEAKLPVGSKLRLVLPVISRDDEPVLTQDNGVVMNKPAGALRLTWNVSPDTFEPAARLYHPMPGLQALPLSFELAPGKVVAVTLTEA